MKLKDVINNDFNASFINLTKGSILDIPQRTALEIKKIAKKRNEELKNFEEMRLALCKELAEKDENKEPVLLPDNKFKITAENEVALKKKLDELLEVDVVIISQKIDFKDIAKLGLNVQDLIALDEIISDPVI